jgi:hypothetical protein
MCNTIHITQEVPGRRRTSEEDLDLTCFDIVLESQVVGSNEVEVAR